MKNLINLFKLIELTRSQVQYGYLLSGVRRDDLSNLAEHHYLVTFMAWQLAVNLKEAGAKVDVQKVLEFCLVHDLGELMGGDISGPYAGINKRARRFAKAFEEENQKYLSQFFGTNAKQFKKAGKEILDAKSDEALIAKLADYLECSAFMAYVGVMTKTAKKFNFEKTSNYARKLKDKTAKKILQEFLVEWFKQINRTDYQEILRK